MEIRIWAAGDKEANEILRQAAQKCRYRWAWMKLRNARFHLIENRTTKVEEGQYYKQPFVANGDIYGPPGA